MSLRLLTYLQAVHAFDHAPLRHDLGVYHVPFGELTGGERSPEERLAGATGRGERVVVVGRSGSGKSSLIEYVLGPSAAGVAPVAVSMAGEPAEVVASVQAVAGLIVQTLVDQADLGEGEGAAALEGVVPQRSRHPPGRR